MGEADMVVALEVAAGGGGVKVPLDEEIFDGRLVGDGRDRVGDGVHILY
jgi:hypothetical protein